MSSSIQVKTILKDRNEYENLKIPACNGRWSCFISRLNCTKQVVQNA